VRNPATWYDSAKLTVWEICQVSCSCRMLMLSTACFYASVLAHVCVLACFTANHSSALSLAQSEGLTHGSASGSSSAHNQTTSPQLQWYSNPRSSMTTSLHPCLSPLPSLPS
jgi:hypothetical protein